MFRLILRDTVYETLNDAYWWYEKQMPGLGERLLQETEDCFEKLKHHPTYYSKDKEHYRQLILKHFPYKIIFEILGSDVVVYAVFHTSRNPDKMFE